MILEEFLKQMSWTVPDLITDSDGRQWHLTIHPDAEIMPPMIGADYIVLKDDIQARGLEEPIRVVNSTEAQGIWTGAVLDGRNRLRCCVELGLPPKIKTEQIADTVATVLSLNLARRHLTFGQTVASAAHLLNSVGKNYTVAEVAELFQVGREALDRFLYLQKHAPQFADLVWIGGTTINAAYEQCRRMAEDRYKLLDYTDLLDVFTKQRLSPAEYAEWDAQREKPPVTPGSPAEPGFLYDLKGTITSVKTARRKVARTDKYLSQRPDRDSDTELARHLCQRLITAIDMFTSETGGIEKSLKDTGFI